MRIRALLFIPALAAAALAIGVSSASAATLFTSTAHTTRVSVGTTWDATSVGTIDLTTSPNVKANTCHSVLAGSVTANNMTTGVSLQVTSGTFNCNNRVVTPTGFPWTLTISGNGTVIGTNTAYTAALDLVHFDVDTIGTFRGNLTSGITAVQPNSGTSPITITAATAGGWLAAPIPGATIDGSYRFTGAAAGWSLTN